MARPKPVALQEQFRQLSTFLYDTSVSAEVLEREVMPFIADDVVFVDPWQQGGGRDHYRLGLAGFHRMLKFDLDLFQVNVTLDEGAGKGRAIVDGVMNLRLLEPLLTYPLRTILVYDFTLTEAGGFLIHRHEEMWSLGDMIEAVPLFGWFYKNVFRKGFSKGFLLASRLSIRGEARSLSVSPPS
jgi:hypothetical protein